MVAALFDRAGIPAYRLALAVTGCAGQAEDAVERAFALIGRNAELGVDLGEDERRLLIETQREAERVRSAGHFETARAVNPVDLSALTRDEARAVIGVSLARRTRAEVAVEMGILVGEVDRLLASGLSRLATRPAPSGRGGDFRSRDPKVSGNGRGHRSSGRVTDQREPHFGSDPAAK